MKLTRNCEVGIGLLIYCAYRPGVLVKTNDAAAYAGGTLPQAHQQTLRLVRAGYLESLRGKSGGIRLAKNADQMILSDVIRLLQPQLSHRKARFGNAGFDIVMNEIMRSSFCILDSFTIADLVAEEPGSRFTNSTTPAQNNLKPLSQNASLMFN